MIKLKAGLAAPSMAQTLSVTNPTGSPIGALDRAAEPDLGGFDTQAAIEILEVASDRLAAGDLAAVRVAAAQLRRRFPDHPDVLREAGRCWLNGESPSEAVTDLRRSIELAPDQAEVWFLLTAAYDRLGDPESAAQAAQEAASKAPDKIDYAAFAAAALVRVDDRWREGLLRLIDLQLANPGDDFITEHLAEAYLHLALREWTVVETEDGAPSVARAAQKILRIAAGSDVPPGLYPTEAIHVSTAAVCLERLKALPLRAPALLERVQGLAQLVQSGKARKMRATWGELGLSAFMIFGGGFAIASGEMLVAAAFLMVCGAGMLIGSFEPKYRTNKIALSKRGETIGDTALSAVSRHKYGGIAYNLFLMSTYPFIAGYKLYVNWGKGWLAKPEIASIHGGAPPAFKDVSSSREGLARGSDSTGGASGTEQVASSSLKPVDPAAPDLPAEQPGRDITADPGVAEASTVPEAHALPAAVHAPTPVIHKAEPSDHLKDKFAGQRGPHPASGGASTNPPRSSEHGPGLLERFRRILTSLKSHLRRAPPILWMGLAALVVLGAGVAGWAALKTQTIGSGANGPASPNSTATVPALPSAIAGSPSVIDTGALTINGQQIKLDGILGEGGVPAQEMVRFITQQGGTVSCAAQPNGAYRCHTPQGYDVAAAALFNGAARVSTEASEDYRKLQADAQAAKKGIWQ